MPPHVEPLTSVDAAWLGMEDPTNLMMVTGILTFETPLDMPRLKQILKHRFLCFERFRQRVVQPALPLAPPYWETVTGFDLDNHLSTTRLPAPADQAALQELASELMSTPLDFAKPLWQILIVENYGRGSAAIVRLHHSIGDGMALVFVLLSLTDLAPDIAPPPGEPVYKDGPGTEPGGLLGAWMKQSRSRLAQARRVARKTVREGLEAVTIPARALDLALQGADHALAAGRLVLRSPDPKTLFKGKLGVRKRGAWSRPLPLKEVKSIKEVAGGTVNDVLISAMTGGLRRYMESRGEATKGVNFRTAVPVNLRTKEEIGTLGNKFGIVFLSLPVGIGDPLQRLAEVRRRMNALKNTPEAAAAFGILNAIGMSPAELQTTIVEMFGAKTTAVMTNVPGPPIPLYLAGSEIESIMFWVPQSGRVSLGISIISYAGKVWLGVAADAGLIPDPHVIVDGFYDEYDALLALVKAQQRPVTVRDATKEMDPERCQAKTKKGRQCRNRMMSGSRYCRTHQ